MKKMVDWQRIWDDDGNTSGNHLLKIITRILSAFYFLIVTFRNWLYDHGVFEERRLPCPVISVGNITVGGTGKTPCVMMLARMLQQSGFRPAVISRGYGGESSDAVNIVSDGEKILLDGEMAGDEPVLMAKSLLGIPVVTGAKRIVTGKVVIDKFGANVLICDDAMQHRQIFRDINLVLLDNSVLKNRQHLLPRGRLREPVSGIKRASAVLLTRTDEGAYINESMADILEAENIPVFKSVHRAVAIISADGRVSQPMSELKDKNICAFCGIANPGSFEKTLLAAGARILSFDIFPDHHHFKKPELEKLKAGFMRQNADYLLTTEKDVMRLQKQTEFFKTVSFVRIDLEMTDPDDKFKKFILQKLSTANNHTAIRDIQ
ncbi:MAG: tetraacyldisaccharide 4'-kinase [Smithella sp.]|nr:tetraacyldisaccharide 4'-kinase [Smithella sp.]